jgi:hypothetical protein
MGQKVHSLWVGFSMLSLMQAAGAADRDVPVLDIKECPVARGTMLWLEAHPATNAVSYAERAACRCNVKGVFPSLLRLLWVRNHEPTSNKVKLIDLLGRFLPEY